MSNAVQGVCNAGYSAVVRSAGSTLVKGAIIVGIAGAAIAGIGYGLEKAGHKLGDVGRARGNQSLENIGNGCEWLGHKVHVGGKYVFLAVTVPIYAAGRWTIRVAIPRLWRLAVDVICHYGPIVIHQVERGFNWANANIIQPLNDRVVVPTIDFIRRHSGGIIRHIGRGFNWAAENALKPFYHRLVIPVITHLTRAAIYALCKIADFGRYLGRHISPILDRMIQAVERVARLAFNMIIRPLYTYVLTPIGQTIVLATSRVLYPVLNVAAATARQIGVVIDQAFTQINLQVTRIFG